MNFRNHVDRLLDDALGVFGEEMTLCPLDSTQENYKIRGVFDSDYQAIDVDTQEVISANQSTIGVNLNRVNGNKIKKGDVFKLRNTSYKAIDSREDGQGGATVIVQKVNCDTTTDISES